MDMNEFLAELDGEAAITRRFLNAIPPDQLHFKAHPKSNTLGQAALHLARIPLGITMMAQQDTAQAPNFSKPQAQPADLSEVLAAFESAIAFAKSNLPALAPKLTDTWTAFRDGKPLTSMPRSDVLRQLLMNHLIHHRGQLGVYLRLVGAKVPFSYGPSADESPFD